MVNAQEVTRLTDELQRLRGAVVRDGQQMADRVDRVLRDARRLHEEARGTVYEPALRSVENLLGCVQRGLAAGAEDHARLRPAG